MSWDILHCFADEGVESECLSAYGDVVRVGIDAKDTNESEPIKADARQLPFSDNVEFDFGLFHPPCQRWAKGSYVHGDPEDRHENMIPIAREIAEKYCDEWVIENVPQAPLNNPVTLNGGMFGLPLHYERSFETSYHVDQPRNQTRLVEPPDKIDDHHSTGGFQGSKVLWKSLKGYSGDYSSRCLKRSSVPRVYIDYLVRQLL